MRYFFLFLIIFPFIEIYTLIVIGGSIGAFTTMLWIFFSGIMGLYLLRNQGLKTLLDIQSKKSVFEPTADNFLKTIFTPIGGFFLLIPGFITDVIGILVLLPITRIFILGGKSPGEGESEIHNFDNIIFSAPVVRDSD